MNEDTLKFIMSFLFWHFLFMFSDDISVDNFSTFVLEVVLSVLFVYNPCKQEPKKEIKVDYKKEPIA